MALRAESLKDAVYVELVRSLFATGLPSLIMSAAFALTVALIRNAVEDPLLLLIGGSGMLACVVRLTVVFCHRREAFDKALDAARARTLEKRFTLSYLAFALCLGAFGGDVFLLPSPEAHMLTICLLVGYCAGVAAGVGLRPKVAIPAMLLAIGPTITISFLRHEAIYAGMGLIAAAMLAGGVHSVIVRHRITMTEISKRMTFGSIARCDGLTELPNRLALREWFDERINLPPHDESIAVHYLDLDGFKPVNDRYGHLVGDALLQAVAGRLSGALRSGDIAARLGGDEFAILQCGLRHPQESELLVQRIISALDKSFSIDDHEIHISASVGTVVTGDKSSDLEQLLLEADKALYIAKRRRKGLSDEIAAA